MPEADQPNGQLRLADMLAALSLESDLGMGHPPEEAMRTCLLATGLARRIGFSEAEVAAIYWTSLLMHIGCTAFAHEQAALFGGNEIAVNDHGSRTDFGNPREALSFLIELGRGLPATQRARILFVGLARGERFGQEVASATCEVGSRMALRLGMPPPVQQGLLQMFERWDGKGSPQKLKGEAIALPARVADLAAQVVVFDRIGGIEAAVEMARRRGGTALDPNLTGAFVRHAVDLLADIHSGDPWQAVLDAEPAPQQCVPESGIDAVAGTFADAVDLKSPYTLGHSKRVAQLAEEAGRGMGLLESDVSCLRRAGYFHDLGRVSVPNGIWQKKGPLTAAEWEQVRLHPYHSERILARSPVLAPLALLVGMHHERLDGSGYHRKATAAEIPMTARVLAAADVYEGATREKPHRPAYSTAGAADHLRDEMKAGRLDARAVEAVLSAAGHERGRTVRQNWPGGLTDREVEVLRLIVRGMSNREAGKQLFISPKTVGSHIEHIYQKLGVSSRAAAAMFAMQNDLLL